MDREERKYEARRRVFRMILMRFLLAALLVWAICTSDLTLPVVLVLIGVIILILATMVPALIAVKSDLKYDE